MLLLAKNSIISWLLLAVLMVVATAPPGGLELCIGEDGHMHLGANGDDDHHDDSEDCICLGDGCACPTSGDDHTDLGLESVALVQRESNDSLLALLPAPAPLPTVLVPILEAVARPKLVGSDSSCFARPPQWPAASRTIVLRS